MSLRLRSGDEQLVLGVACMPYDSLHDLIEGLSALLVEARDEVLVRWNCEPEEYDFKIRAQGDDIALTVTRFPDHRRRKSASQEVFAHTGSRMEMCSAFWRELRELQRRSEEDVFASNWRRAFPQRELQELTRLIRERH